MKTFLFVAMCLVFSSAEVAKKPAKVIYDLPGSKVSSKIICTRSRVCQCGLEDDDDNTITYQFATKPYSPTVVDESTVKSIALSVVGKSVPISAQGAADFLPLPSMERFKESDIDITGSNTGLAFKYATSSKTVIDVNATVEADILELIGGNAVSQSLIDSLKAQLTASYNNVKDKKLTIDGVYYELRLGENATVNLRTSESARACREALQSSERGVVTDISLIVFNLDRSFGVERKIIADLEAKLLREGITADLTARVERNVLKSLNTSVKNAYAIISYVKRKV
jgi:hypothetical protein